jgi:hypothetical protein
MKGRGGLVCIHTQIGVLFFFLRVLKGVGLGWRWLRELDWLGWLQVGWEWSGAWALSYHIIFYYLFFFLPSSFSLRMRDSDSLMRVEILACLDLT